LGLPLPGMELCCQIRVQSPLTIQAKNLKISWQARYTLTFQRAEYIIKEVDLINWATRTGVFFSRSYLIPQVQQPNSAMTCFEAMPYLRAVFRFSFRLWALSAEAWQGAEGLPNCVSGPGESGLLRQSSTRRSKPAAPSVQGTSLSLFFCLKSDSVTNTKSALSPTAMCSHCLTCTPETVTFYSIFTPLQKQFPTTSMF